MAQSTIFPIFIRSEYKSDGKAFQGFQSEAARAAAAAKREFAGVSAAIDQALSRPRNAAGALDLGVDELRKAALAQQQVAIAAREVAEATRRAAQANGGFDASLSRSTRSAFEYANAQERSSREMLEQLAILDRVQAELGQVASATNAATAASRRGTMVAGQQRSGMQQLSFQLNDIATQFALGAKPQQIFAAQAGQVIQAVQLMTGGTSRLAAFLGGPWGLALTSAAIVVTPFIGKLFEAGEAADAAKVGANSLATAQGVLGDVFDLASGKIANQNELLRLNARLTALNLRSEALAKGASARATFAAAGKRSTGDQFFGDGVSDTAAARVGIAPRQSRGQNNAATVRALLEGVKAGRISADEALKRSDKLDFSGTGATAEEFRQAIIDQAFSKDAERVAALINESLDTGTLAPELRRDRKTRQPRSNRSAANKAAREAERLKDFGEQAAESIARLNARFDEQPRLVDAAAQATRELDVIIKGLGERKPAGFKELIAEAEKAKAVVESALVRPFDQLRQESEQRLQIETLLAQGREDEAAALQEALRIERQRGDITAEQRAEVEAIVRAEAERTRYLRDQQRLFAAQLDVVDQVQRSLTDLLSGRSSDFFGDFRQALRDLQGQRLFEDLFGGAFRSIRDELAKSTPQGRATAAFVEQVTITASATQQVGAAAISLAESFAEARALMESSTAAANDNEFANGMTVTGKRPEKPEVEIARVSITDLANRISKGIGDSIGAELEGVFGPRFAAIFGDIVGGFIAGKVTGGTTGGIIGALKGVVDSQKDENGELSKGLADLSETLGAAGQGAAVGSQVNAFGKLFGFRGSKSGSQIGGAIGGAAFGPIGALAGAIAGNIIGGLLRKTPRASATIGGIGGSLGITGVRGNKSALRDQSSGLAGGVLDSIDNIARQLGASVDASKGSVSIGIRSGNFRLDTSGQGRTKTKKGAIDFGEDGEAAVRAAVLDLIQDGVITGLRAAESRLLKAAKDVESGLRDALTFRSVFDRLREIKDPVGFAVEQVAREFDGFRDLFKRAGADASELAKLEELAGIERTRAVEEATDRVAGALKSLLAGLKVGDNGLSLRDRRGNAVGQFDRLAARVAAGDSSAFDDFAEVSQQLLDIERQLFGSTQAYFDRFNQITALTERAIADQTNVTSIGAATPSPFDEQKAITRTIDSQTEALASRLDRINENLVTALTPGLRSVAGDGGGSGRGSLPAFVANF